MSRVPEQADEGRGAPLEGEWLPPEDGADERALGSDPFAAVHDPDPFHTGLGALGFGAMPPPAEEPHRVRAKAVVGQRSASARPTRPPRPVEAKFAREAETARPRRPQRLRARTTRTPALRDVELGAPEDWLDRVLDDEHRRRLLALMHFASADAGYDRYGLSPATLRRVYPLLLALYRAWFRVRSSGHEHIPRTGPAILAANHGGLLPFDGAMLVMDVALSTDPPRLARAIVDHWAGSLPFVNVFFARVGQVIGTRENFADLLSDDQLVLVFPEGMNGVRKLVTQRYRLQGFHVGFVEQALRAEAPVIPTAVIGSDDQAPILFDLKPLARMLGLPMAPITPTFPLLGPLGLIPYPVPYRVVYGEPLPFHERFGPEDADDPRLVRYLARIVRKEVQALIDRHR